MIPIPALGKRRYGSPTIRHFLRSIFEFLWFLVTGLFFNTVAASFFPEFGVIFGHDVADNWEVFRRENQWHKYLLNAHPRAARLPVLRGGERNSVFTLIVAYLPAAVKKEKCPSS